MRILVAEDNEMVAESLDRGLAETGYAVQLALNGREALDRATAEDFDLLILDRMLPEVSGDDVCRQLRLRKSNIPILMLTARAEINDRVAGLDLGADDYMTKPFAFQELLARVRALLRRGEACTPPVLQFEDLELDPASHEVSRAGKKISLSAREFALLEFLMRQPNRVAPKDEIVAHVWGDALASNAVEVYINYLRRKIDKGYDIKLIHNVRGVGYVLRRET